jgi:hypothetical protein
LQAAKREGKKSVMLLQGLVATQSKMLSLGFGRGNYKNKK